MDDSLVTTTRRRPRRLLFWGLFGLTGILMGTAWATGFGNSDTTIDGTGTADEVLGLESVETETISPYVGAVTNTGNIAISFDGQWGVIDSDVVVFTVDLSAEDPGETFYTDIYLRNAPLAADPDRWSAAQLKWLYVPCLADAAAFTTADVAPPQTNWTGDTDPRIMNITVSDARVSFPNLAGGGTYCFGLRSSANDIAPDESTSPHADDIDGNFLRRPNVAVTPLDPEFTAVVNRSA